MAMIDVFARDQSRARVNVSVEDDHSWIVLQMGGDTVSIHGTAKQADAFKMMADIFNDAFAKPDQG